MFKDLLMVSALFLCCVAALLLAGIHGHNESMKRGNEAATVSALDIIPRAQRAYSADHGGTYGTFQQLLRAGFLDARYGSDRPRLNSYAFTMTVMPKSAGSQKDAFSINADPDGPGARVRHFYLDVEGLVHVNSSHSSSANDPLLDDPELK